MILLLIGVYLGGFIYVLGCASTDPDCPEFLSAFLSALGWPWGLYMVMTQLGGASR